MKQLTVRPARADESENITAWGEPLSAGVIKSPQTEVLCIENGRPVSYATVQAVGVIRSLATNPEAGAGERALALRELVRVMDGLFDEVLWFAGTEEDAELESLALRHGFERVEWRCYRKAKE